MHTKAIAVGGEKGRKWTATPRGPHKKTESIPLIDVLKMLDLADKSEEAEKIISGGMIEVDGKPVKDSKYGVGLMDVLSIPKTKENFIVTTAKKGFTLKVVGSSKTKLCRVIGKRTLTGGKTQLNLHDGTNLISDKKVKVNDTIVLELPGRKLKEVIPYEAGNHVLVVSGRHRCEKGVVKEVLPGTAARKSLTAIGDFKTLTEYVFVIGKDKPMVEV
ncbi:MAG: S4 domain-containing protein [Candidatus Altiarchaeota archaeon]